MHDQTVQLRDNNNKTDHQPIPALLDPSNNLQKSKKRKGHKIKNTKDSQMFKRLADKVTNALAGVNGSSPSSVETLKSMGFSEDQSRHALQLHSDNVERAAEWLLTHGTTTSAAAHAGNTQQVEDDDIQRALALSLADNHVNNNNVRSAASRKAGQAALARFEQKNNTKITNNTRNNNRNNTKTTTTTRKKSPPPPGAAPTPAFQQQPLAVTHPKVQVPARLSQHAKEDVILRCAQRIAPHPVAVDTLLKSLKQLQANPHHEKFQSIDTQSAAYMKNLNAPGVKDFFKAMNYHPIPPPNGPVLKLSFVDAATLYLGISALEQVQETSLEYKNNKAKILFDKELLALMAKADSDMEEAIARAELAKKLPSEPTSGGGGIMTIELGTTGEKLSRKFDGDDTLGDVIHWLGANAGSTIPEKLLNKSWHLMDRNHADAPPFPIEELQSKTLQYIGCWPSGRLALCIPTQTATTTTNHLISSSRGLGAAPRDFLQTT